METFEALNRIHESGVIAILRVRSEETLLRLTEALLEGGGDVMEVTMNTPGALEWLQQTRARYGSKVLLGAGTVLDEATARAAILAGAAFIVSPTLSLEVIQVCHRHGVLVVPGAYTPTEVLTAWEAGAGLVKVFPASIGGPAYLRALREPLPQVRLCAVGGVNLDNLGAFFRAGAYAVGVGGALVNQEILDRQDFATLTDRMRRLLEAVREARSDSSSTQQRE